MSAMEFVRKTLAYAFLLLITFLMCFPLLWALSTSLKPARDVMATPPRLKHHWTPPTAVGARLSTADVSCFRTGSITGTTSALG